MSLTPRSGGSSRAAHIALDSGPSGAEGNQRLTAWAGSALLLGFGAEGLTILNIHWWLTAHMLIGFMLMIPVGLKIASTGYRFFQYYSHSPAYRLKGAPHPVLRIMAPFLLANTVFILISGPMIMVAGSYRHQVEELHKLSLWSWLALAGVHVLFYIRRIPYLLIADLLAKDTSRSAAVQRIAAVVGSGAAGMLLALGVMPWVRAWIRA